MRGRIDIDFAVDDDRVLAAHLGDDALDPDLSLLRLRCEFVDPQPDVARSGEGDESCLRMRDHHVADLRAAADHQREALRGKARFEQALRRTCARSSAFRSRASRS